FTCLIFLFFFFFFCSLHPLALHSFPTRRSSDLAWYLSFAPLEKPVMAMAVLLEGPGPGISFYGGKNAAPIAAQLMPGPGPSSRTDRKSTRLNSSHRTISYAVFCLKKKTNTQT